MANVPYDPTPDTGARTTAPDDQQRIQTDPGQFGAAIGQGLQNAGAGMTKASTFFGQVAADDATNQFQDYATKLLHGDPNKQIPGPDGTMQPDTGYMGLKGRAALDARAGLEQQLTEKEKEVRGNLQSPEQQLQFDSYTRRYRAGVAEKIGSYADSQATSWYGNVNKSTADLALTHIANNADDDSAVKAGAADLIHSYTKTAQLAGAQPGDAMWKDAETRGRQDAFKAQLEAISVHDPARAADMLEKNKDAMGQNYEPLANQFRARADQQAGTAAGHAAVAGASPNVQTHVGGAPAPLFVQAGNQYGVSPTYLARTAQIESGGDPHAHNASSGADGLFQFIPDTWRQYGRGGNSRDPVAATDAAARLAASNQASLTRVLGRAPSDGELYLAHQQGPAGAEALLANPNMPAADALAQAYHGDRAVAARAIRANGGNPDAPASAFSGMWTAKFGGGGLATVTPGGGQPMTMPAGTSGAPGDVAPDVQQPTIEAATPATATTAAPTAPTGAPAPTPQQPVTQKADAYQKIDDMVASGKLTEAAANHAYQVINQEIQRREIAENLTAKDRKEKNDKSANSYVSEMLTGQKPDIVDRIAADPNLTWETKRALGDAATHASGDAMNAKTYGPGFAKAYQNVLAPAGDPDRISDATDVLRRAGPGGDLTISGAEKLLQVMGQARRSVDDQAVHTAKSGLINYAKSKLSFDQEMLIPGLPPMKDPKGAQIFNAQFIPRYEAAYDTWVKDGKNPYDFLTQENVDKMIKGMRSPSEMAMARMAATGEVGGETPGQSQVAPAPQGIEPKAWNAVAALPPVAESGKPFTRDSWGKALRMLVEKPTDDTIAQFNASKFGKAGADGKQLLGQLLGSQDTRQANAAKLISGVEGAQPAPVAAPAGAPGALGATGPAPAPGAGAPVPPAVAEHKAIINDSLLAIAEGRSPKFLPKFESEPAAPETPEQQVAREAAPSQHAAQIGAVSGTFQNIAAAGQRARDTAGAETAKQTRDLLEQHLAALDRQEQALSQYSRDSTVYKSQSHVIAHQRTYLQSQLDKLK